MKMDRATLTVGLVWICMAAVAACGDDDAASGNKPDVGAAGKAGHAANGGAGGAAGHAGAAGKSNAAGHSGSAAAGDTGGGGDVKCGTATCSSPAQAMGFIMGCCADEATSTCGTAMMGGACAKPVADDPRCPGLNVMGFVMLPSCCATNGMCGIDASMFGMPGCVDLESAAKQAMSMGGGADIPAPRACDAAGGDAGI
jgi:hypothetical protein